MYLPKHFAAPSQEAIESLVRDYPLAQVVVADTDGQLICNPVPLLLRGCLQTGSCLVGHVARANPLWRHAGAALAIFTGPQVYITPNAYPGKAEHHRVVPTYNYATVQVRGQLVARDEPAIKHAVVNELTQFAEQDQPHPWSVSDAPEDYLDASLKAIVAIEIQIESVTAKFKLSQNRNAADRAGVQSYLAGVDTDGDAAAMLQIMQTLHHDKH
ncbi:FMN-binding negative transcriptional regulator [Orrella daihaiensis]|uniref:FMN-binding negative transcriptional regulator n=1 Tax=Orrella daihaiensis TaxID=2782176 RepID=A0ABY4AK23_9BURK|nr:FMN-binding negative transcriptional regulator [Orrella daihaiensis]UOD50637.1 FMN-binding negative transcriptional regulator [Orrella daihaiensis]